MPRPVILVVEDDEHEQEIYGRVLWYNGFDVVFARDATEGLELARRHRPDLALLDLMLPGVDGLTLCATLHRDPATMDMPVLVLSALPADKAAGAARKFGCLRYLEKPTSPVEVLHAVEAVIGRAPSPAPQPGEAALPPPAWESVDAATWPGRPTAGTPSIRG